MKCNIIYSSFWSACVGDTCQKYFSIYFYGNHMYGVQLKCKIPSLGYWCSPVLMDFLISFLIKLLLQWNTSKKININQQKEKLLGREYQLAPNCFSYCAEIDISVNINWFVCKCSKWTICDFFFWKIKSDVNLIRATVILSQSWINRSLCNYKNIYNPTTLYYICSCKSYISILSLSFSIIKLLWYFKWNSSSQSISRNYLWRRSLSLFYG